MLHGNVKLFAGGLYASLWTVTIGCAIYNVVTSKSSRKISLEEQVEMEMEKHDQMILHIFDIQPKQNRE